MPILRENELDIISHSVEQTQRLGVRLGALLGAGDVVCLSGDMGAGKTVLAAGIGQGWGATTALTSPTFNLVHQHEREKDALCLFHIDCYRLHGPEDAETIGLDDIFDGTNAVVVEWPERLETSLPAERLWIELRILEETRRNFIFEATGERHRDLIANFRERAFGV